MTHSRIVTLIAALSVALVGLLIRQGQKPIEERLDTLEKLIIQMTDLLDKQE